MHKNGVMRSLLIKEYIIVLNGHLAVSTGTR